MERDRAGDSVGRRIAAVAERVRDLQARDRYFYNPTVEPLPGGARALVEGREMLLMASYSYLGLLGHPRIAAAAAEALGRYGTGTHGVRLLAGTLPLHGRLEETIADFKGADAALTYSSGYITNLSVISTLVGRGDWVLCDKLNHASIVDGCQLSGAAFHRFRHNDAADLERRLRRAPAGAAKLVVADAVFSMDGDVLELPAVSAACRRQGAWLMVDEAHALGVLGATGRGIEEHFGLPGAVDVAMGSLSKAIPSVGGYVAGGRDLVALLRHTSRAYVFSAALPPAQAAAAAEAFAVIAEEPWRLERLRAGAARFARGLSSRGFDTLGTTTPIVPVLCGSDERAFAMTGACRRQDVFVQPVVSPAVPPGRARLRVTVSAAHEPGEVDLAVERIGRAGREAGLVR